MAGNMITAPSEQLETPAEGTTSSSLSFSQSLPLASVIGQWEVEYARYVNFPPLDSLRSTHQSLIPKSTVYRKRFRSGPWLKTSSAGVFVKFIQNSSASPGEAILVVSLGDRVLEEHYVSKVHFSWPHVSCVSGFPARGTRAVFVSYKDGREQPDWMQKFALRFPDIYETENFITVLKEILEDIPPSEIELDVSSQAEYVPSNCPSSKSAAETWRGVACLDSSTYQIPTTMNFEVPQPSDGQEKILRDDAEKMFSAFPPSFTSFLMNCCPVAEQGVEKAKVSADADFKNQLTKYMKDPSFQDILTKAEQLITELGEDILFP